MHAHALEVVGAHAFTPEVFPDRRGIFLSPFLESALVGAVGHPLFPVAQVSYNVSHKGVVRGLHYTATPPGMAKYVYCPHGEVLDVVLDVRVGSPTFGRWDAVILDDRTHRGLYIPVGVAHMFVVLREQSIMTYIMSQEYVPENELALYPLDPALELPFPEGLEPILSDRDSIAPRLEQAVAEGLLPDYAVCAETETGFAR